MIGLLALLPVSLVLTVVGLARGSWVAMLASAMCSFPMSMYMGAKPLALTFAQVGVAVGFRWGWNRLTTFASALVAVGVYIGLLYGLPTGVRAVKHLPPPVVEYRARRYFAPLTTPCAREASLYGPLHDSGQKVIGLPILMTVREEALPYVPTVLILQRDSQTCLVYSLEGGP